MSKLSIDLALQWDRKIIKASKKAKKLPIESVNHPNDREHHEDDPYYWERMDRAEEKEETFIDRDLEADRKERINDLRSEMNKNNIWK